MMDNITQVDSVCLEAVQRANAMHVYGGAKFFGEQDSVETTPHESSLLARVMINRCPLVYCH